MKKIYFSICIVLLGHSMYAQCGKGVAGFAPFDAGSLTLGNRTFMNSTQWGGEYNLVSNMIPGGTYRFDLCDQTGAGNSAHDSQLTGFEGGTTTALGFDDNTCTAGAGDDAQLDLVAPATGQVDIQINQSPCASNATNYTIHITYVSAPLPVELLSWVGRQVNSSVLLQWTTAIEENNSYFDILRKEIGTGYLPIGRVTGAGNSSSARHYEYYDRQPLPGENWYKLRQVDFDGQETLSPPLAVNVQLSLSLSIDQMYPVPPSDVLNIAFFTPEDGEIEINVFDQMGRRVLNQRDITNSGWDTAKLAVSTLTSGTYTVSLRKGSKVVTGKFAK